MEQILAQIYFQVPKELKLNLFHSLDCGQAETTPGKVLVEQIDDSTCF